MQNLVRIPSLPYAFNAVAVNGVRLPDFTMIYNANGDSLGTIQELSEMHGQSANVEQRMDDLVRDGIYYDANLLGKRVAVVEHDGGKRNTKKSKRGKTNRKKSNRRKTNRRKTNRRRI